MTTQVNLGKIWAITGQIEDPGDTKYALGWQAEIPTFQNFNFVLQNYDKNLLALAERAAFEWQDNISYARGAKVIRNFETFYSVSSDNLNHEPDVPPADPDFQHWKRGETWGDHGGFTKVTGNMLYKITEQINNSSDWFGTDCTLVNLDGALLNLVSTGAFNNILFGNHRGELITKTVSTIEPDGSDLTPGAGSSRIFHEGHPPTQSEVDGTIPANPSDGKLYGRKDGNWVQVTTTTIAEHPPQPVVGNGAGWYNLQDGRFYIDIDDGDSSQWVPASPIAALETNYVLKSGDIMEGALTILSNLAALSVSSNVGVNRPGMYLSNIVNNKYVNKELHTDGTVVTELKSFSTIVTKTSLKPSGILNIVDGNDVAVDPVADGDLSNKKYTDGTLVDAINGYHVDSSGVITQWGSFDIIGNSTDAQIVFPLEFPSNVRAFTISVEGISTSTPHTVNYNNLVTTGVKVNSWDLDVKSLSTVRIKWTAVGI